MVFRFIRAREHKCFFQQCMINPEARVASWQQRHFVFYDPLFNLLMHVSFCSTFLSAKIINAWAAAGWSWSPFYIFFTSLSYSKIIQWKGHHLYLWGYRCFTTVTNAKDKDTEASTASHCYCIILKENLGFLGNNVYYLPFTIFFFIFLPPHGKLLISQKHLRHL